MKFLVTCTPNFMAKKLYSKSYFLIKVINNDKFEQLYHAYKRDFSKLYSDNPQVYRSNFYNYLINQNVEKLIKEYDTFQQVLLDYPALMLK